MYIIYALICCSSHLIVCENKPYIQILGIRLELACNSLVRECHEKAISSIYNLKRLPSLALVASYNPGRNILVNVNWWNIILKWEVIIQFSELPSPIAMVE